MLPEPQQHCPLLLTGSAAPTPLLLTSLLATTLHSLLLHSAAASPSPALTPPLPLPRYLRISISFFQEKGLLFELIFRKTEALGIISIQVYFERDELDHGKTD